MNDRDSMPQPDYNDKRITSRDLRPAIIYLECGCSVPMNSADEIMPRVGWPLWCFHCERNVTVLRVTR